MMQLSPRLFLKASDKGAKSSLLSISKDTTFENISGCGSSITLTTDEWSEMA
jgi:hypothetical protein